MKPAQTLNNLKYIRLHRTVRSECLSAGHVEKHHRNTEALVFFSAFILCTEHWSTDLIDIPAVLPNCQ